MSVSFKNLRAKIHQISEKQNIFVLFFVKKGEEGWVNVPFS